jgi:UDP-N-acetylmuramoyl-tripeptide--D-alanyl-D-alanine ligase
MLNREPVERLVRNEIEIADPELLASIVDGKWTAMPEKPIQAIRCSLDHLEPYDNNFLFIPELFWRLGGIGSDNARLTCLEAMERGASAVLVSEHPRNLALNAPCLIVEDPAEALSRLAAHNRANSSAHFIAVTGSAGKSTTKEMIAAMLSASGEGAKSIYNYNAGRTSVEFTLANVAPDHDFCCAEFSVVGDIETQGEIFRPNVAVITNVMWEHFDHFEKKGLSGEEVVDAIVEGKTSLIRNLSEGGHAILNRDDETFQKQREVARQRPDVRVVTFGEHPDADVRLISTEARENGSLVRAEVFGHEVSYHVGIDGRHMAVNSLAALAVAKVLDADIDAVVDEMSWLEAGFRRGEVHTVPWGNGSITAINETVSAHVPAIRALFKTLSERPVGHGGRRIAVLGWIGDVGATTVEKMKELASEAAASQIDYFYTNGEDMRHFNRFFPDRSRIAPHAGSPDQLRRMLEAELRPGDVVAFKSNRKPPEFSLRHLWERMIDPLIKPPSEHAIDEPEVLDEVRVVLGGDTYFGEYYQSLRASKAKINYLEEFGYGYSIERLAPLFQRADVGVLNLECALTEMERSPLKGKKGYILGGKPRETTEVLRAFGIDAVLLGNNHAMDYGEEGLRDTLDALDDANIEAVGAGRNKMSSQEAFTCEFYRAGSRLKLAIISAYEYNDLHENEFRFYSGEKRWGVNNINIPRLRDQIAALKAEGYYVVVSPHWGENYCFRNYDQKRLARRIINDCRADLILGHGAHVYQEFDRVDDNWVFYSIGNLIFNSEGEYSRHNLMPYSYIPELCFQFHAGGWRPVLNVYPIVSCNQITQFQPDFVDDGQFDQLTTSLRAMSYDPQAFDEKVAQCQEDGRHFYRIDLI